MKDLTLYYATNRNHLGADRWQPTAYGSKFSDDGAENLRFGKVTLSADEKRIGEFLAKDVGFGAGDGEISVIKGVARYGEHFIKRKDPRGRSYYWATNDPPPRDDSEETDLTALTKGFITLTPLQYNMTRHAVLAEMERAWKLEVPE